MNKSLESILNLYTPEVVGLIYCLEDELTFQSEDYFNLFYLTNGLIKNHLINNHVVDPLILTQFYEQDTFIKVFNPKNATNISNMIISLQNSLPQIFKNKKMILIKVASLEMNKQLELEISSMLKKLKIEIKLVI